MAARKSEKWWKATKEDYWSHADQSEVTTELDRARASEVELAALLRDSAPRFSVSNGPCWCATNEPVAPDDEDHGERCRSRRVAIRNAGEAA